MRRAEAARARHDTRAWAVERRARTRRLIELGGLVQKAGLVELVSDDRATLYGAMLDLAYRLNSEEGPQLTQLWRRRGKRAFEADAKEAD